MISILHPSRGRPQKSFDTINKFIDKAGIEIEVIISLDEDDPTLPEYKRLLAGRDYTKFRYYAHQNRSAIDAINLAAVSATKDILFVVSDDTDCGNSWAVELLQFIGNRKDFIVKTQDGIQPWIITNPIMHWDYYKRFNYVYNPHYKHMFSDSELTCVADLTGRKITSNILFKHNHYSVTKETPDAISKRADATWDQGEKLFLERYKRNFDLPPDQIKGKIEDNGMINWLQRKAR